MDKKHLTQAKKEELVRLCREEKLTINQISEMDTMPGPAFTLLYCTEVIIEEHLKGISVHDIGERLKHKENTIARFIFRWYLYNGEHTSIEPSFTTNRDAYSKMYGTVMNLRSNGKTANAISEFLKNQGCKESISKSTIGRLIIQMDLFDKIKRSLDNDTPKETEDTEEQPTKETEEQPTTETENSKEEQPTTEDTIEKSIETDGTIKDSTEQTTEQPINYRQESLLYGENFYPNWDFSNKWNGYQGDFEKPKGRQKKAMIIRGGASSVLSGEPLDLTNFFNAESDIQCDHLNPKNNGGLDFILNWGVSKRRENNKKSTHALDSKDNPYHSMVTKQKEDVRHLSIEDVDYAFALQPVVQQYLKKDLDDTKKALQFIIKHTTLRYNKAALIKGDLLWLDWQLCYFKDYFEFEVDSLPIDECYEPLPSKIKNFLTYEDAGEGFWAACLIQRFLRDTKDVLGEDPLVLLQSGTLLSNIVMKVVSTILGEHYTTQSKNLDKDTL